VPDAPLIVVNPVAGGGRARRLLPWIRDRIAARPDVDLRVTARTGEAEALAAEAAAAGRTRVVAVGGDGTVQEVVNGLLSMPSPASLGVVPAGTGNDLARSLGLPRDPAEAWTIAIGSTVGRIDAATATDGAGRRRWFASAGGIGFDAQVAAAMATRRGLGATRAGYLLTTLAELRRFRNCRVQLAIDGVARELDVLFVAIANGAFYGGGMQIVPGARLDDGRLDVCVVGDISRPTALRQLPNLYRGTHVNHPAVAVHAGARRITVEGETTTRVHLDGEPFGSLPVEVEIAPGALVVARAARADATLRP
jgi:diacylglycerol kinase (ATP)